MDSASDSEDGEHQSENSENAELSDTDSSSDDDDETPATVRSYATLLQTLSAEGTHQTKRRKLQHDTTKDLKVTLNAAAAADADEDVEIEELEEGPETAVDELIEDMDDDADDSLDPFDTHFAHPDEDILSQRLKALQKMEWFSQTTSISNIGKAILSTPKSTEGISSLSKPITKADELRLKQRLKGSMFKLRPRLDAVEQTMAPLIFGYQDVLFCERTIKNAENLRRLTCLHAVNHVFK